MAWQLTREAQVQEVVCYVPDCMNIPQMLQLEDNLNITVTDLWLHRASELMRVRYGAKPWLMGKDSSEVSLPERAEILLWGLRKSTDKQEIEHLAEVIAKCKPVFLVLMVKDHAHVPSQVAGLSFEGSRHLNFEQVPRGDFKSIILYASDSLHHENRMTRGSI